LLSNVVGPSVAAAWILGIWLGIWERTTREGQAWGADRLAQGSCTGGFGSGHVAGEPGCGSGAADSYVAGASWFAVDGEVVTVDLVVVVAAQEDAVVDRGFAVVSVPPVDVVDLAPAGGLGAAVELAAAVADDDGSALFARVEASGSAKIDGDVLGIHDDARDLGIAQYPGQLVERHGSAVLEDRRLHLTRRPRVSRWP